MQPQFTPTGPVPAKIMIVGEAPGEHEVKQGKPFVGPSGHELDAMLQDAGIIRAECYCTNVLRVRPHNNELTSKYVKDFNPNRHYVTDKKGAAARAPGWRYENGLWVHPLVDEGRERLRREIEAVQPNVIVAFGNLALWALAGSDINMSSYAGVATWQGSILECTLVRRADGAPYKVIPALHPAYIIRSYSDRFTTVEYLRRARREAQRPELTKPEWKFIVRPELKEVLMRLVALEVQLERRPIKLVFDLETRAGHIACLGLGWSPLKAICIPFMCVEDNEGYWSLDGEVQIIRGLRRVLCHPNAKVIGQNLLYDMQYLAKWWGFVPKVHMDTMIAFHTCFPVGPSKPRDDVSDEKEKGSIGGPRKGLDGQASIFANYYRYWKDDGKNWEENMDEEQLWYYNCLDCHYTWVCAETLESVIESFGLQEQAAFMQAMFEPVLAMMLHGARYDHAARARITKQLERDMNEKQKFIERIVGHSFNPRSADVCRDFFYEDLKIKPVLHRKTKKPTLDKNALPIIAKREPLVRPLVAAIREYRSFGNLRSNILEKEIAEKDRVRCSYNLCGTETYRLSSSEDAFGFGCNLQNITKGDKEEDEFGIQRPNLRPLFIPESGYVMVEADLDRADLQVVVWEADDAELKQMLREGADIHVENAKLLFNTTDVKEHQRQMAKVFVHGTNYGGSPRTMAINCGITIAQSEALQRRWFAAHPGIGEWHERTNNELLTRSLVYNRFGFRRFYFDRVTDYRNPGRSPLLGEALAWVPQSTVGLAINKGILRVYREMPEIILTFQTHDSATLQIPEELTTPQYLEKVRETLTVTIPYEDPLRIPLSLNVSRRSWGEMTPIKRYTEDELKEALAA